MLPQAPINLVMDTTYFGRKWGVMMLYDAISKRALRGPVTDPDGEHSGGV